MMIASYLQGQRLVQKTKGKCDFKKFYMLGRMNRQNTEQWKYILYDIIISACDFCPYLQNTQNQE